VNYVLDSYGENRLSGTLPPALEPQSICSSSRKKDRINILRINVQAIPKIAALGFILVRIYPLFNSNIQQTKKLGLQICFSGGHRSHFIFMLQSQILMTSSPWKLMQKATLSSVPGNNSSVVPRDSVKTLCIISEIDGLIGSRSTMYMQTGVDRSSDRPRGNSRQKFKVSSYISLYIEPRERHPSF